MAVSMKWLHDNLVPLYWSSQYGGEVGVIAPQNRYCTLLDDWCVCVRVRVCLHTFMHACTCVCMCTWHVHVYVQQ